jgi:type I restriction enzyme, S subunit
MGLRIIAYPAFRDAAGGDGFHEFIALEYISLLYPGSAANPGHDDLYVSHGARDLTEKGFHSSSATLMPKGSVLFTSRAPIGYAAIAANEISTNQGFKSVVPYVPDCSRYIATYLTAFAPWIDSKASGTTFREEDRIGPSFPPPTARRTAPHRRQGR